MEKTNDAIVCKEQANCKIKKNVLELLCLYILHFSVEVII